MSTTEKDRSKTGGPNGTGDDESRDQVLDRNIAALLSESPDPPRMEPVARDRILASLKERVQKEDAPAPAASPGLAPGEVEGVQPEVADPLPAVEEKQDRGMRIPAAAVIVGIGVIGLGAGLLGYHFRTRSEEREQARVQTHREKKMKKELASLKKSQEDLKSELAALRRVASEKDQLLRKLQEASVAEKVALKQRLAKLNKRAQTLADRVKRRRAKRGRRAARRGSAPLPRRRPAAAKSLEALHGL